VVERQAQNVFVEMPRLLGIARLVGVVVQLLDGSRGGQGGGVGPGGQRSWRGSSNQSCKFYYS
jgi:hypothetical protein